MGRTNRPFGPALRLILLAVSATTISSGCAPTEGGPAARKEPIRRSADRPAPPQQRTAPRPGAAPAPLAATDPCSVRLHDISGLLLLYYVTNHRLPAKLEDLAPLADSDTDFQTTCPVSGQPYAYIPNGLAGVGTGRVLLVYDAVPAHAGVRWVIVASPPQGDQPLATWVMPFTEERFRRHAPSGGN